jgi:putative antitoxin of VapBC-like toxin-antitoxin system
MRTTVLLKDELVIKARKLSREKSLSGLLNTCLSDWIAHHSQKELEARLAAEYRDSNQEARRTVRDFAAVDKEGWPPW